MALGRRAKPRFNNHLRADHPMAKNLALALPFLEVANPPSSVAPRDAGPNRHGINVVFSPSMTTDLYGPTLQPCLPAVSTGYIWYALNAGALALKSWTISVAFKRISTANSNSILSWADVHDSSFPFVLFREAAGNIEWLFDDSGTYRFIQAQAAGVWCHHIVTYDSIANVYSLYVDGKKYGTYTGSTTYFSNALRVFLGEGFSGTFNGFLDHAYLWTVPLHPSQVGAVFSDPFAMFRERVDYSYLRALAPSVPTGAPAMSYWEARLRAKIYQQFADKPNILALVTTVFAPQVQAIEDAAQALISITSIDDSSGTQLDVIGAIIRQARAGLVDALYRLYLKARIAANRSSGTHDDIYSVFFLLFGLTMVMAIRDDTGGPAFELVIADVLTAAEANVGVGFLRDSKADGVRANLLWQESDSAELFTFDIGPGFDQGKFAGAAAAE